MIINYIRFCKILGLLSLATTIGAQTLPKVTLSQQVQSNNLSETADTVFVSKFLNVDTSTLYVDAVNNRVGVGTSSPSATFHINSFIDSNDLSRIVFYGNGNPSFPDRQTFAEYSGTHNFNKNNSSFLNFAPTLNIKSSYFFPFLYYHDINIESNFAGIQNFNSIPNLKNLNGYSITDYSNAYYRNDFYSTDGSITNSYVFKLASPIFWISGGTKPTNNYGMQIENQGASGITTSYGLYIDSQSGSTTNYSLYIGGGTVEIDGLAESVQTALYINANGVVSKGTSSIRFKTDIKDYNKGLDYLMKLNPVWFTYKSSGQTNAGFIAEQIHEAGLEEFVTYTDDGQIEGLKGEYLKPLIVKAIQEQQAIIETQEQEIETLKTQIQLILNEIEQLKNK